MTERRFDSEEVPEWLDHLWQVLDRGEALFARLWSLPHAADAADRIEKLSLNELRAVVLAQVHHMHSSRDAEAGQVWAEEGAEVRGWIDA